jgi:hypothetical protein
MDEVVQPTAVSLGDTSLGDLSLDDYRASRAEESAKETPTVKATETPDAGDDSLDTGTPEQIERKKKLGGFQKTIARQDAELVELRRKVAEGEKPAVAKPAVATPETPAVEAPPAKVAAPQPKLEYAVAKPLLEDYATIEDWGEALGDWRDNKRDWVKAETSKQTTATTAAKTLTDAWQANVAAFVEDNPDYTDAIKSVDHIKLSPDHQRIFLKLDKGAGVAVAYELAQDPAELQRIADLDPLDAAVVIGQMAKQYTITGNAVASEPEIKVSSAPKPFKPVNGGNSKVTPNVDTLGLADYRKARESGRIN